MAEISSTTNNDDNIGNRESDDRVSAFSRARDAIAAAQMVVSGRLNPLQRRKMLARLRVSYDFAGEFMPLLCERLEFQSIDERHETFAWILALIDRGIDLSPLVNVLAKQLSDSNYALRKKATTVLIRMGSAAEPATARAVGLLRSPFDDVRENALNLLAAIGPQVADIALPKIEQMRNTNLPSAIAEAAKKCEQVLRGEISAADYLAVAKPSTNRQKRKHKIITTVDCDDDFAQKIARLFPADSAIMINALESEIAKKFVENGEETDLVIIRIAAATQLDLLKNMREHSAYRQLPIFIYAPIPDRRIAFAVAEFHVGGLFHNDTPEDEILLACKNAMQVN